MGNTSGFPSSSFKFQTELNIKDYNLSQERNDQRFGHIYVMRSKNSSKNVLVKERPVTERPDELIRRLEVSNDYLLKIFNAKEIPGTGSYQVYFEDFATDLNSEIRRHLAEKTRFPEGELYAILYCTISALSALEQKGIAHENINPTNILKQSREVYKIHDNYLLSAHNTIYQQALKGSWTRYLAPELFDSWVQKKPVPDTYNPHKVDVFCIGMAVLDAGLLQTEGDFISKKLNVIDELRLKEKIKKFGSIYSSSLTRILEDVLCLDPSRRPGPTTLFRRLPGRPVARGQTSSGKKRRLYTDTSKNSSPQVDHLFSLIYFFIEI